MSTEELERQLANDLDSLGDDLVDAELSRQLYRALCNNRWSRRDGPEGAVALSWARAERLVNDLRARHGAEPMTLVQTGGEGEVGELAGDVLGRLGWTADPLDTSRHDPAHAGEPSASPSPPGAGDEQAPVDDSRGWEREGHREAEASRRGDPSAPPRTHGEGAGGGHVPSEKA